MAEIWNMAGRATARTDGYVNQVLRATADVELLHGPDYRITVGPASGGGMLTPYWGASAPQNARIILSRWPVLQVTGVKTCPNGVWPRTWTAVPSGYFEPELPPIGIYGSVSPGGSAEGSQAILVGGGYINRSLGRNGWAVEVSYINGWPHCSLSAAAAAGATTISVNDCTGWAVTSFYGAYTGATGRVEDSGQQEAVHVTAASVTAGPGTLTLASPLNYPHQTGTLVTTMPASIQQACIYFATAEALTRGATSTTIHAVGGASQSSDKGAEDLIAEGELLLHAFRRTILYLFVWFPGFLVAGLMPVAAGEQAGGLARPERLTLARYRIDAGAVVVRPACLAFLPLGAFEPTAVTRHRLMQVQDGQFSLAPGDRVLRVIRGDVEHVLVRLRAAKDDQPPLLAVNVDPDLIVRRVVALGFPGDAARGRRRYRPPRLDLLPRPCGHVRFAHAQTLPPPLLVAA